MQINKKIALVATAMVVVSFIASAYFLQLAWADDSDVAPYGRGGWSISGDSPYYGLADLLFSQAVCFFFLVLLTHWYEVKIVKAFQYLTFAIVLGLSCFSIYTKLLTIMNLSQHEYLRELVTRMKWSLVLDILVLCVIVVCVKPMLFPQKRS